MLVIFGCSLTVLLFSISTKMLNLVGLTLLEDLVIGKTQPADPSQKYWLDLGELVLQRFDDGSWGACVELYSNISRSGAWI